MDRIDQTRKAQPIAADLHFQVQAPTLRVEADIRLRSVCERWISVSEAMGREVTGIGPTARGAVEASLSWLGPLVMTELLADLRLLEVSRELLARTAN